MFSSATTNAPKPRGCNFLFWPWPTIPSSVQLPFPLMKPQDRHSKGKVCPLDCMAIDHRAKPTQSGTLFKLRKTQRSCTQRTHVGRRRHPMGVVLRVHGERDAMDVITMCILAHSSLPVHNGRNVDLLGGRCAPPSFPVVLHRRFVGLP
uniref:Uncharacterized protein n=1 Tax=Lotharella globosa TaxID=91324 RepID=A0A7S3YTA5_9EUKA